MEKLNIVLRNHNYFFIGNFEDYIEILIWVPGIVVGIFICWFIVTYFESVKRVWSEKRIKNFLDKIRKVKINNSHTNGKLRKIRNYSSRQLKHEMRLFSIHVRKRSKKDTQKMFNKYFFEILDESFVCITNLAHTNRMLKVYFDTKKINIYLEQVLGVVETFSPKVVEKYQHLFCKFYDSLKDGDALHTLEECDHNQALEDTKNLILEILESFESAKDRFSHPH